MEHRPASIMIGQPEKYVGKKRVLKCSILQKLIDFDAIQDELIRVHDQNAPLVGATFPTPLLVLNAIP
jgi:hypothetical protein